MTQSEKLIKKANPDSADQFAFRSIKNWVDNAYEDHWINALLIRFHCKPLSYYLLKYQIS